MFSQFRSLSAYRLNRDIPLNVEDVLKQCEAFRFTPCGSQDIARSGFISPITRDNDGPLVHSEGGFMMALIKHETKLLPTDVRTEALNAKIKKMEAAQGRKLKKTEKDSLKDEVLHTLLPRAFSRYGTTAVLFDLDGRRIFINASAKQSENALALIRKSLGSLPVIPLTMETPIELTLTAWLKEGEIPAGFTMGERAQLKALLEAGGIITCNKQDLQSDEIGAHLDAGKLVTKLALDWQERVQFVIDDGGFISGIKFSDSLRDQNDDIDREDVALRASADILLMGAELVALVDNLTAALGGEAKR
jgi:recombination associated protein RdgC